MQVNYPNIPYDQLWASMTLKTRIKSIVSDGKNFSGLFYSIFFFTLPSSSYRKATSVFYKSLYHSHLSTSWVLAPSTQAIKTCHRTEKCLLWHLKIKNTAAAFASICASINVFYFSLAITRDQKIEGGGKESAQIRRDCNNTKLGAKS